MTQNNIEIGMTIVSGGYPNTLDSFWFVLADDITEMPGELRKSAKFAKPEEVVFALGIPEMSYPILAQIMEMSNGIQVPISLDISYLVGPDTVHVNASGISGIAKTSHIFFLLQSVYQKFKKYSEEYAIIIFNTKYGDLLHIDKREDEIKVKNSEKKFFDILDLETNPYDKVTYFFPRDKDGRPNSIYIPKNSKTYSYELEDVYDKLELLFSQTYDPHYNISSIVNYIYEFWPIKNTAASSKGHEVVVKTWTDLFNFTGYPEEVITHRSSILHFQGHVYRFRKSSLFIDKKVTSTYLGKEINQVKSGDVFVVDIAILSTLEEQPFVIGDVMKSIDEMYSAIVETTHGNEDNNAPAADNHKKKKA